MEYLGGAYPDPFQSLSTAHQSQHEISKVEKKDSSYVNWVHSQTSISVVPFLLKFLSIHGLRTKCLFDIMCIPPSSLALILCPIFLQHTWSLHFGEVFQCFRKRRHIMKTENFFVSISNFSPLFKLQVKYYLWEFLAVIPLPHVREGKQLCLYPLLFSDWGLWIKLAKGRLTGEEVYFTCT